MKPAIIRVLTLASFLIFMLPFVQMCSHSMRYPSETEAAEPTTGNAVVVDTIALQDTATVTQSSAFPEPVNEANRDSFFYNKESNNAYELAYCLFGDFPDLLSIATYFFLSYTLMILVSAFMVIKAFQSKYRAVRKLALVNIGLLLLSVVLHYFCHELKYWWQIKYGFYLFLINMLCVMFLASSLLKEKTNNR
ncbi:hypothetical protein ACLI1A_08305 [Flavobacterium sp. RHBU_3]|uniref:hypothetical protein n=1 Tax=Flavobacterium sp. RHBU_3 TaxID=3391184 RepID=UPI0039846427